MTQTAVLRRRRAPIGPPLLVGLVTGVIALLGNLAAARLTDWSAEWSWLAVPALSVGVSMLAALAESRVELSLPDGTPVEMVQGHAIPVDLPRRRHGVPLTAALLVTALVLGLGGYAVTRAVQYVSGWVTGQEAGAQLLERPRSTTSKHVTLRVEGIEETAHFTRVTAVVSNGLDNEISLTAGHNSTLTSDDGTTLQADGLRGDWAEGFGPGDTHRGTIIFPGRLGPAAQTATLAFARVWEAGFTGPKSMKVAGLQLHHPS